MTSSRISSPSFSRRLIITLAMMSLLALTLSVTSGTAYAQAKQLRVRGSLQHVHGVNLPWVVNNSGSNYGHDLGPNNFTGYGNGYHGADMDGYFQDIKNMHTNVVRIWLFEDLEGLNFDGNGYITGINATFLSNINDMLNRANNKGLAIELVLFNHTIGNNFGRSPAVGGGAGIRNFFTDAGAQTALINNVIKPLAQAQNNKLSVFGYDLMNEANYAVSPFSGLSASANWSQMHSWVYNLAQAIHSVNSAIQVTTSTDDVNSFTSANHWNRFGGVGLNYYEYHSYSDSPSLFTYGSSGPYPTIDKPLVLGEYGARTTNDVNLQATVTDSFINQASYGGWAGSLAWTYNANGNDVYSVVYGLNNWKPAAWKIQWWGQNQFGL